MRWGTTAFCGAGNLADYIPHSFYVIVVSISSVANDLLGCDAFDLSQEAEMKAMNKANSGQGAETVYRDKKGRKVDMLTEFKKKQEAKADKKVWDRFGLTLTNALCLEPRLEALFTCYFVRCGRGAGDCLVYGTMALVYTFLGVALA